MVRLGAWRGGGARWCAMRKPEEPGWLVWVRGEVAWTDSDKNTGRASLARLGAWMGSGDYDDVRRSVEKLLGFSRLFLFKKDDKNNLLNARAVAGIIAEPPMTSTASRYLELFSSPPAARALLKIATSKGCLLLASRRTCLA